MHTPHNKEWIERLEKLLTIDTLSYSTMSGHAVCKVDPDELLEFVTALLSIELERQRMEIREEIVNSDYRSPDKEHELSEWSNGYKDRTTDVLSLPSLQDNNTTR